MAKGFNYKKATQAVNFFIRRKDEENKSLSRVDALKLVYLTDRYHLRQYGRSITNDVYFAMKRGPVASSVKDLIDSESNYLSKIEEEYSKRFFEKGVNEHIFSLNKVDTDVFSETDLEALEFVSKNFLNNVDLVKLTHQYPEWKKFEKQLETKESSRFAMNTLDFFDNPKEINDDKFLQEKKILDSSKQEFIENNDIGIILAV